MYKVKDFYDFLDGIAPYNTQFDFDNSGLNCGNFNCSVNKVGVCLDVTAAVVEEAKQKGIDLIISHHPVIFDGLKSLDFDSPVAIAAKYRINALSAHTNLDSAEGGVNDCLCEAIGLKQVEIFDGYTMARIGNLAKPMTTTQLCKSICSSLKISGVTAVEKTGKIKKAAVCSGSGGFYIDRAIKSGVDCLITGEAKHHETLLAQQYNLALIMCGHFASENVVVAPLIKKLKKNFKQIDIVKLNQANPLKVVSND